MIHSPGTGDGATHSGGVAPAVRACLCSKAAEAERATLEAARRTDAWRRNGGTGGGSAHRCVRGGLRGSYHWRRRDRHDTVAGAAGAAVPVCGRPDTRAAEWRRKTEGRRGVEEVGARRGCGVDGGRPPTHGVVGRPPRVGAVVADRAVPDGGERKTPTRPPFLSRGTDQQDLPRSPPLCHKVVGQAAARQPGGRGLVAASGGSRGGGGQRRWRARRRGRGQGRRWGRPRAPPHRLRTAPTKETGATVEPASVGGPA